MKKYQIFVSSTYEDLKEERAQVINGILEMGHIPVGMEMFSARDESQWELIKKIIDDCDYYVVIVANRYGSTDSDDISFTEKEYDYACSIGIPTLGFVIHSSTKWPSNLTDKNQDKVNFFKEKIRNKLISYWESKADLYGKVAISLSKIFFSHPRQGWTKAENSNLNHEIARLSSENNHLKQKIEDLNTERRIITNSKKIIPLLSDLSLKIDIKYEADTEFTEQKNTSVLQFFEAIYPHLLKGSTLNALAWIAAFHIRENISRKPAPVEKWPAPRNSMHEAMEKLQTLGLAEPTNIGEVDHGQATWKITELGQKTKKMINLQRLQNEIKIQQKKTKNKN